MLSFLRIKRRVNVGLRLTGAALLLTTAVGLPQAEPKPAKAANLSWSDVRPPLTDEADTNGADGYTPLPTFGAVPHAIVVAPNGDVFTAGSTGSAWHVFRSTTGGKSWRVAATPNVPGSSTIRQIVVSPDYPSDGWVGFVYSDETAADGVPSVTDNGFCWAPSFPLGVGATFGTTNCLDFVDGGVFANINLRTVAVSADFNWGDSSGELAVGGNQEAGTSSVAIAQTSALKSTPAASDFILTTDPDGDVSDVTGHLAYNNNEEPIALARLWVNLNATGDGPAGAGTYGQLLTAGVWEAATASTQISTNLADYGQVGFDDEYSSGSAYFAAVSLTGAPAGGVYRFSGSTWSIKTSGSVDCNTDMSSLGVAGDGASVKIVASLPGSNAVCRTINEGNSWTDRVTDGDDDVCNACNVIPTGAITFVASHRSNPSVVYYTTSAALGGVF